MAFLANIFGYVDPRLASDAPNSNKALPPTSLAASFSHAAFKRILADRPDGNSQPSANRLSRLSTHVFQPVVKDFRV